MSDLSKVIGELKQFVVAEFLDGQDSGLDESTPLLELGVLDSISLISLIGLLEQRYGVRFPDSAMVPQNFKNLRAIAEFLESAKNAKPA